MYKVVSEIKPEKAEMRAAFAAVMDELAAADPAVCYFDCDVINSTGMVNFCEKYPDRGVDCGIQEANMISVAAGLSAEGKIPFAHTFGVFATRRACDQVFLSCCYARQNVKIIGSDPGITSALNGGTHMAFEDLGIMRVIPEITIVEPTDLVMIRDLVPQIAAAPGVFYLRLVRRTCPEVYAEGSTFTIGKANILREGTDVTLIAMGYCVSQALLAAEQLSREGIEARVIDMFTLKPIDREAVMAAARETGAIVTAENHNILNGLGSAVAEIIAEEAPAALVRIGAQDRFGQVGKRDFLAQEYGMDAEHIYKAALQAIQNKKEGK